MTTEPTGQNGPSPSPTIDEAVAGLGSLDDLPITDHPAVFEAIHRVLRDQLAGTPDARP